MSRARRALGAQGESAAARHYENLGYRVVERNWRRREGELDLILAHGPLMVFCEVKTRSSNAFGSPAEAVTVAKQRRIRALARSYLTAPAFRPAEIRFDVACVTPDGIEVIEAAF